MKNIYRLCVFVLKCICKHVYAGHLQLAPTFSFSFQFSFSSVPWNLVDVNIKLVNKTFSKKNKCQNINSFRTLSLQLHVL